MARPRGRGPARSLGSATLPGIACRLAPRTHAARIRSSSCHSRGSPQTPRARRPRAPAPARSTVTPFARGRPTCDAPAARRPAPPASPTCVACAASCAATRRSAASCAAGARQSAGAATAQRPPARAAAAQQLAQVGGAAGEGLARLRRQHSLDHVASRLQVHHVFSPSPRTVLHVCGRGGGAEGGRGCRGGRAWAAAPHRSEQQHHAARHGSRSRSQPRSTLTGVEERGQARGQHVAVPAALAPARLDAVRRDVGGERLEARGQRVQLGQGGKVVCGRARRQTSRTWPSWSGPGGGGQGVAGEGQRVCAVVRAGRRAVASGHMGVARCPAEQSGRQAGCPRAAPQRPSRPHHEDEASRRGPAVGTQRLLHVVVVQHLEGAEAEREGARRTRAGSSAAPSCSSDQRGARDSRAAQHAAPATSPVTCSSGWPSSVAVWRRTAA